MQNRMMALIAVAVIAVAVAGAGIYYYLGGGRKSRRDQDPHTG